MNIRRSSGCEIRQDYRRNNEFRKKNYSKKIKWGQNLGIDGPVILCDSSISHADSHMYMNVNNITPFFFCFFHTIGN